MSKGWVWVGVGVDVGGVCVCVSVCERETDRACGGVEGGI